MEDWKGLLKSKTVWGVIIMIIGTALGWPADMQADILGSSQLLISAVVEAVGAVLAIYGRVKAKSQISGVL